MVQWIYTWRAFKTFSCTLLCYCCCQLQQDWAPSITFLQRLTGHLQWYIAKMKEIVVENEALYLAWSWSVQSVWTISEPAFYFFFFFSPGPLCTLVKKSCPQRWMPINSLKSNKSGHSSSSVRIYCPVCLCVILFYPSNVEKKQDSRAIFFGDCSPS